MTIITEPYATYVDFNKYSGIYPKEKADGSGINQILNYCVCHGEADGGNRDEKTIISIEYLKHKTCLNIKIHMY